MSSVQLYDALKAAFVVDSTSKDSHTGDATQAGALTSLVVKFD